MEEGRGSGRIAPHLEIFVVVVEEDAVDEVRHAVVEEVRRDVPAEEGERGAGDPDPGAGRGQGNPERPIRCTKPPLLGNQLTLPSPPPPADPMTMRRSRSLVLAQLRQQWGAVCLQNSRPHSRCSRWMSATVRDVS